MLITHRELFRECYLYLGICPSRPSGNTSEGLRSLRCSRGEPKGASPHVPDVGEDEEELSQTPVLLLQGQACFGHQVDQGVCDLVQDTVDMVLLFQRLQGAGQKCVHS